jgi:glycosyltransferase involved in cell wall biosynthesis
LVQQTIFVKRQMEILVIDSCSEQKEGEIVKEFQDRYDGIRYIRTDKRENLYKSWNRAIIEANGEYLTNANTDDRHHKKCIELLLENLEENPEIDIAYGNLYKSAIANETFEQNDKLKPCTSQKFFPSSLIIHNYVGAQPLWRKSIHEKIGLFDERFKVIGDYEFILRAVVNGSKLSHVPEAKGLMLWHQNALSTKDSKGHEEKEIMLRNYRVQEKIVRFYAPYLSESDSLLHAYNDLGIRSLCYYPQFNLGLPLFDFKFAEECFSKGTDTISKSNLISLNKIIHLPSKIRDSTFNYNEIFFYSSKEKLPMEYELKGVKPSYLCHIGEEIIQGKSYQKYSFDLLKFHHSYFGHLDENLFLSSSSIFIWGYNERGKLYGNYLQNMGQKNLRYVDSNPTLFSRSEKSNCSLPIHFNDLRITGNAIFILAMSSHHWTEIQEKILLKFPELLIFRLDHA